MPVWTETKFSIGSLHSTSINRNTFHFSCAQLSWLTSINMLKSRRGSHSHILSIYLAAIGVLWNSQKPESMRYVFAFDSSNCHTRFPRLRCHNLYSGRVNNNASLYSALSGRLDIKGPLAYIILCVQCTPIGTMDGQIAKPACCRAVWRSEYVVK